MIEGKRPERVLIKSDSQTVSCPACSKQITVSHDAKQATCSCGQLINWGLRT